MVNVDKDVDNEENSMFTVKVKKIRCTPRKMALVCNFVRKKKLSDAVESLKFIHKKAAPIVGKALSSLISQIDDRSFNSDDYGIKRLVVGKSMCLKRRFGRAKGRVDTRRIVYSMLYIEAIPQKFLIGGK